MNSVFTVKQFLKTPQKIGGRGILPLSIEKPITYNWSGTGRNEAIYYSFTLNVPCTHTYTFLS